MEIETFLLERNQSLYENEVEINLTESGVEALPVSKLLNPDELKKLAVLHLGYGYTEGSPELRAAIATWYPGASSDNVLVTTGAAEANFVTIWALCQPGDEIVFATPNFLQIQGIARAFGVRLRTVLLDPEQHWRLDIEALAAARIS